MVTSFGLISPELTTIIQALEAFQDFEPEVSRTAGALQSAKLGKNLSPNQQEVLAQIETKVEGEG